MRVATLVVATLFTLMSTGTATAAAIWTVSASTSDGAPLSGVTPGAQLILDIGLTTTSPGELLGIAGSVNDYDGSMVSFSSASVFSDSLLHSVCFPTLGCFGGVTNLESRVRSEVGREGRGHEDTFVSLLTVTPAAGDGTLDQPFPQFRLIYDIIGPPGSSTTLRIGTFADYADAYTGGDGIVHNTSVFISYGIGVPEPGTGLLLGLGLTGLAGSKRRD